jgi:tetratricopeptide (TPR) repeat protein
MSSVSPAAAAAAESIKNNLLQAKQYVDQQNYESTIQLVNKLLDNIHKLADFTEKDRKKKAEFLYNAYLLLGLSLFKTSQFKQSEESYLKAININPDVLTAYKQLFDLYLTDITAPIQSKITNLNKLILLNKDESKLLQYEIQLIEYLSQQPQQLETAKSKLLQLLNGKNSSLLPHLARLYSLLISVQETLESTERQAELSLRIDRQIKKYRQTRAENESKSRAKTSLDPNQGRLAAQQQEEEEAEIVRKVTAKLALDFTQKSAELDQYYAEANSKIPCNSDCNHQIPSNYINRLIGQLRGQNSAESYEKLVEIIISACKTMQNTHKSAIFPYELMAGISAEFYFDHEVERRQKLRNICLAGLNQCASSEQSNNSGGGNNFKILQYYMAITEMDLLSSEPFPLEISALFSSIDAPLVSSSSGAITDTKSSAINLLLQNLANSTPFSPYYIIFVYFLAYKQRKMSERDNSEALQHILTALSFLKTTYSANFPQDQRVSSAVTLLELILAQIYLYLGLDQRLLDKSHAILTKISANLDEENPNSVALRSFCALKLAKIALHRIPTQYSIAEKQITLALQAQPRSLAALTLKFSVFLQQFSENREKVEQQSFDREASKEMGGDSVQSEKLDGIRADLEQIVAANSENSSLRGLLCLVYYYSAGKYLETKEFLYQSCVKCVELDKSNGIALSLLGKYVENVLKNEKKALACYLKAISADPSNDYAVKWLCELIFAKKRENLALISTICTRSIESNPRNHWNYYYLAEFHVDQGNFLLASQFYNKSIQYCSNYSSPLLYYKLSVAYFSQKQLQPALKSAEKAFSLNNFNILVVFQLCYTQIMLALRAEAIETLEKTIKHYENGVQSNAKGEVELFPLIFLLSQGYYDRACSELSLGLMKSAIFYNNLAASALEKLLESSATAATLSITFKLLADCYNLYYLLPVDDEISAEIAQGVLIQPKKRSFLQKAQQNLARALELRPREASYHADSAVIHFRLGNTTAAIQEINKAIEIEPKNSEFYGIFAGIGINNTAPALISKQNALIRAIKLENEPEKAWSALGLLYLLYNLSSNAGKVVKMIDSNTQGASSGYEHYEAARYCLENAQTINPSYYLLWLAQGLFNSALLASPEIIAANENQLNSFESRCFSCFQRCLELDNSRILASQHNSAAKLAFSHYATLLNSLNLAQFTAEQLISQRNLNYFAQNLAGIIAESKRNYNQAIIYYEKALKLIKIMKLGPEKADFSIIHLNLARSRALNGELSTAIALYTEILQDSAPNTSKTVEIHTNLALLHGNQGNFTEAQQFFNSALQINAELIEKSQESTENREISQLLQQRKQLLLFVAALQLRSNDYSGGKATLLACLGEIEASTAPLDTLHTALALFHAAIHQKDTETSQACIDLLEKARESVISGPKAAENSIIQQLTTQILRCNILLHTSLGQFDQVRRGFIKLIYLFPENMEISNDFLQFLIENQPAQLRKIIPWFNFPDFTSISAANQENFLKRLQLLAKAHKIVGVSPQSRAKISLERKPAENQPNDTQHSESYEESYTENDDFGAETRRKVDFAHNYALEYAEKHKFYGFPNSSARSERSLAARNVFLSPESAENWEILIENCGEPAAALNLYAVLLQKLQFQAVLAQKTERNSEIIVGKIAQQLSQLQFNYIRALLAAENIEIAERMLQTVEESQENQIILKILQAQLAVKQGNGAAAVNIIEEGLRLEGNNLELWELLVNLYRRGATDSKIRETLYCTALEQLKSSQSPYKSQFLVQYSLELLDIYLESRNFSSAEKLIQQFITNFGSESAELCYRQGKLAELQQNSAAALKIYVTAYNTAIESQLEVVGLMESLSLALQKAGKQELLQHLQ